MKKTPKKRIWRLYNESLVKRGDVTLWFDEEAIAVWREPIRLGKRGRPQQFSDACIEVLLTIREVFHLTYRSAEGFARSMFKLLQIEETLVPDYTLLCKRAKTIDIKVKTYRRTQPTVFLIDSTGLKVYGEGEWKVRAHGVSKRRTWRKIHILRGNDGQIHACLTTDSSVDDATAGIVLLEGIKGKIDTVIADGAYDKRKVYQYASKRGIRPIIPPRKDGRFVSTGSYGKSGHYRNEAVLRSRCGWLNSWKENTGYHKRSLVETEMYRLKQITGSRLKSRLFETQKAEIIIKINLLNKFASMSGIFR